MQGKYCENCKHGLYDDTTGTWDCRKAECLSEDDFYRYFINGESDCPQWETSYDPAEEEYMDEYLRRFT